MINKFIFYEQKQLNRYHHNLKEELNVYINCLQKCIDIVFPEYNSLFKSKYGTIYMSILKEFSSAEKISDTDIRNIRKYFDLKGRGKHISLMAEHLKDVAKSSIVISSISEKIQMKHIIDQIELINAQLNEIDKKQKSSPLKTTLLSYLY